MRKLLLLLCFVVAIYGCTPTTGGFSKPTIFTSPLSYLDSFPLGTVTKDELISNLGIPDKTNEFEGQTYYTYELGEGHGKRQFVYIISGDVVTDVKYHDQGPYNGSSAKKRQHK